MSMYSFPAPGWVGTVPISDYLILAETFVTLRLFMAFFG